MVNIRLRRCASCTPRKPRGRDGGGNKSQQPYGLTKHLITWAAQTWEGHKMKAQPSLYLCGVSENLNLRGLDLGSACNPGPASDSSRQSNLEPEQCRPGKCTWHELAQSQCSQNTASTPHTCQWYLFAVFLPPHSVTEQVSLNKWHLSPLVSGQKLDTEETSKQKKLK